MRTNKRLLTLRCERSEPRRVRPSLPHHPVAADMQLAPMRVAVLEAEGDIPAARRPAASDFVAGVFEAVRQVNLGAVLLARHRVEDRLAAAGGGAFGFAARAAALL